MWHLTSQWLWVPCLGQNLQHFTGNADVSIWVRNSLVGRKTPNIQTTIQTNKRTNERTNKDISRVYNARSHFFFHIQSCIYQHFARLYKDTERLFGCSIIYKEIRHWFRVMSKCLLVSTRVSTEWPPIQHWRTTWSKRTKKRVMCIRVFWIWPNFSYLSHNLNFFQDSQAKSTMMIYFKRFKNKRIRWRVNM